jgi:hypothetical protein
MSTIYKEMEEKVIQDSVHRNMHGMIRWSTSQKQICNLYGTNNLDFVSKIRNQLKSALTP